MSLRLRFFLISWPIVVVSVMLVAMNIERWVSVEIGQFEQVEGNDARTESARLWADSVANAWTGLSPDAVVSLATAIATDTAAPADVIVLDTAGTVVATSDTLVRVATGQTTFSGGVRFDRVATDANGNESVREIFVAGRPIFNAERSLLARLYLFPRVRAPKLPPLGSLHTDLRRTIWLTVLVASLASAGAALLLAGPIVQQIRRLTVAASSIRNGAFSTRVAVQGVGELSDLEQSFNTMAHSLERAEELKRNLVTDVAHELRTPLTNIIGSIEAMQDGIRVVDAASLASLHDEADLLAVLVSELQELSLAESGQLRFDMQPVDSVAVATAAVEAMHASAAGVTLHAPEQQEPIYVRADSRRLAQVLRNLLRNAITHTPPGGSVRVQVASTSDRVTISVSDTGSGIAAEHLGRIWERFHRVDPSRDRASGGMGLGLALVRQLVALMDGTVSVESELGAGSTFRIDLPKSA